VPPVSMGSAGLKYGTDGQVAWDEMWVTFCDLAMAGGPPHKGALLEPGDRTEVDAQSNRYDQVVEQIGRGVTMVTGLRAQRSPVPGWVRVTCLTEGMAAWLLRAIVMENVAARADGHVLDVPAAPHFRVEKEIKNVVTVMAKTCHYWNGHIPLAQQWAIANLFAKMAATSPLVEPALSRDGVRADEDQQVAASIAETIARRTGLRAAQPPHAGWLGMECPSIRAAIWLMRALVVGNVLARREGTLLFVPINPVSDPTGETVASSLARVHHLASAAGIL
jgi:sirohydrochlorin cobaltochelatase